MDTFAIFSVRFVGCSSALNILHSGHHLTWTGFRDDRTGMALSQIGAALPNFGLG